jgi:hypothetical protein
MNKGLLGKILICTVSFSAALCAYLNARNDVTKLMIELPRLSKELSLIDEQNTILRYKVEQFENPAYLLNLLRTSEYASLLSGGSFEVIAIKKDEEVKEQMSQKAKGVFPKTLIGTGVR